MVAVCKDYAAPTELKFLITIIYRDVAPLAL